MFVQLAQQATKLTQQDEEIAALKTQKSEQIVQLKLKVEPEPSTGEPTAAVAAPGSPGATYDLDTLKAGCPAGVDPTAKHLALSDADFEATFKMGKDDFSALPKWKQTGAKKTAGLF